MSINSGNNQSNNLNSKQDRGFLLSYQLKKSKINITESLPVKFSVENQSAGDLGNNVLLRISYVDDNDKKYQLLSEIASIKKSTNKSVVLKFSELYLPSRHFYFLLELFAQEKKITEFQTEQCELSDENILSRIKIQAVESHSSYIIPNNPLIVWVTFLINPIPVIEDLTLHIKLSDKTIKYFEQSYPLIFEPDSKGLLKLPFALNIGDFDAKSINFTLEVNIVSNSVQSPINTKKILLKGTSLLNGVSYASVGFKHEMRLGEVGYLMAELENKTNNNVYGKSQFSFYQPKLSFIKAYDRKFQFGHQDHETVVEDFSVPEYLGGYKYWIICQSLLNLKPLGISLQLEGLSPEFQANLRHPLFYGQIQAPITNIAYFGEDIAVGVDVRVESDHKIKNLECEIIQNLGNISKTTLFRFKVFKFSGQLNTFHWRVPKKYTHCILDLRFLVNNNPIADSNIQKKILDLELFPRPKD
jgi:hypothetical protein